MVDVWGSLMVKGSVTHSDRLMGTQMVMGTGIPTDSSWVTKWVIWWVILKVTESERGMDDLSDQQWGSWSDTL